MASLTLSIKDKYRCILPVKPSRSINREITLIVVSTFRKTEQFIRRAGELRHSCRILHDNREVTTGKYANRRSVGFDRIENQRFSMTDPS